MTLTLKSLADNRAEIDAVRLAGDIIRFGRECVERGVDPVNQLGEVLDALAEKEREGNADLGAIHLSLEVMKHNRQSVNILHRLLATLGDACDKLVLRNHEKDKTADHLLTYVREVHMLYAECVVAFTEADQTAWETWGEGVLAYVSKVREANNAVLEQMSRAENALRQAWSDEVDHFPVTQPPEPPKGVLADLQRARAAAMQQSEQDNGQPEESEQEEKRIIIARESTLPPERPVPTAN